MLRKLTFGDLTEDASAVKASPEEAVLFVYDNSIKPEDIVKGASPLVCAVAGPEEEVQRKKARYEGLKNLEIIYYPPGPAEDNDGYAEPEMTEEETVEAILKSMISPQGLNISRHGSVFNTKDNAEKTFSVPDEEESFELLFEVVRRCGLHHPKFSVFNPNPTQKKAGFLFPQDMFFTKDADALEKLANAGKRHPFCNTCFELRNKKKVPAISVLGAIDEKDRVRLNVTVMYDMVKEIGFIPVFFTVTGANKKLNNRLLAEKLELLGLDASSED